MNQVSRPLISLVALVVALIPCPWIQAQPTTGFNQSGAGPLDYNTSANWVDGIINGVWHSSLELTTNQVVTFGTDTSLAATDGISLNFSYQSDNAGGRLLTLRGDVANRQVTLGGDVLLNTEIANPFPTISLGSLTANQGLNMSLGGATRTFNLVGSGNRAIYVRGVISGGALEGVNKIGAGTLVYDSVAHTYGGNTTISAGELRFLGAGRAENSDFYVSNGANLVINYSASGMATTTRGASLTIGTGNLTISSAANSGPTFYTDTFTDGITVNGGATITLSSANTRSHLLETEFTLAAGGTALFRGTSLGLNATGTLSSTNIKFTNSANLLVGDGDVGTPEVGIIAGAYGDLTTTGSGTDLVTYDAAKGVRLLTANEYTANFANGEGNVRLTGADSSTSTPATPSELNGDATIQSLTLLTSGPGGSAGFVVSGTGDLTITSGTILANQQATGTVSVADRIEISKNLNFGAVEGKILVGATTGNSNSFTSAALRISGVISGSAGLTKAGGGNLVLEGSASNTYTGMTTMNAGILHLRKGSGFNAVTGDLTINGGSMYQFGDQIADTASVTVNGGAWRVAESSSTGTGRSETIASLTINGGSVAGANSSVSGGTLTVTGAVTMNGGTFSQIFGWDANFGSLHLNGGTASLSSFDGSRSTIMTLGALTITNPTSSINSNGGAYTALTVNGHNTHSGGIVKLLGDLTFNGNATNSQSVIIQTTETTNRGAIDLNDTTTTGVTRTFTVHDGAATNDLVINTNIIASGTGGANLVKSGAGALILAGTNTYSGSTTISQGALIINGSLGGTGVTVETGARLGGSGTISAAIGGAGSVNPGNSPGVLTVLQVDPSGGMDFNFEMTLKNAAPTWGSVENDVLRVTSATAFTSALDSDNVISLYLSAALYSSLVDGDVLYGGFYTDAGSNLANVSGSLVQGYYRNDAGAFTYNGLNYSAILGNFAIGEVNNAGPASTPAGYLTQFTYTAVPEGSTSVLLGAGLLLVVARRRRK